MRVKLERNLQHKFKVSLGLVQRGASLHVNNVFCRQLDIGVVEGSHSIEADGKLVHPS